MHDVGYELRTGVHARNDGVFATRSFAEGETVLGGDPGRAVASNHSHANQVALDGWVMESGLGPKVNHSCDPNCGVRPNDHGGFDFVARTRIVAGEELTFDYAMRNYAIDHFPDECLCGTAHCRGAVAGWKDLPEERKAAYGELVAPYLLEIDAVQEPAGRL